MHYGFPHGLGFLFFPLLMLVLAWTLVIKGIALWKSARNNHRAWFVILLVVNTLGILELVYLFWVSRRSGAEAESSPSPEPESK